MSTPEYLGRGKPDGSIMGRASGSGSKIGFYGTTPVSLQTATVGIVADATTTSLRVAVNSIIANSAVYGLDM